MLENKIKQIDFLRFFLGSSNGKSAELIIDKGLLYISEYFGYFKEIVQNPDKKFSLNKEKKLITTLEEIGVQDWKDHYYSQDVEDGTEWELELKINNENKHYYFSGYEKYPTSRGSYLSSKYSDEFKRLLSILNSVSQSSYFL